LSENKSNRTGLALAGLIIAGLAVASIFYEQQWAMLIGPMPPGKDYLGMVINYFLSDPIDVIFGQKEGSGPYLPYLLWGIVWAWASYLIKRLWESWRHITDQVFWTNFIWSAWATIFILTAIIFNAAAQHFQWYACLTPGYCSPQPQGTMDKYTHFLAAGSITAIIVTLNIKDLLGLKGRTGRAIELVIILSAIVLIDQFWTYSESLYPKVYLSLYIDSITDTLADWLGAIFNLLLYNLIVPFEE